MLQSRLFSAEQDAGRHVIGLGRCWSRRNSPYECASDRLPFRFADHSRSNPLENPRDPHRGPCALSARVGMPLALSPSAMALRLVVPPSSRLLMVGAISAALVAARCCRTP